jgi:hypothetical protein
LVLFGGGCSRSVGVAACDQFLERYASCMTAAGPDAKAVMLRNLPARRKAFAELAKSAEGRETLARQCQASLDALAKSCR